eukprot:2827126-Amphidinium_carterae.1
MEAGVQGVCFGVLPFSFNPSACVWLPVLLSIKVTPKLCSSAWKGARSRKLETGLAFDVSEYG